jgi:MraZ protein
MFIGEHQHSLDAKGRLILPAKFRARLGERCIATPGLNRSLSVLPLDEWDIQAQKLRNIPNTNPTTLRFTRFIFSKASECEVDVQGRILIPPHLREYAGINREVMINGAGSRIEIWSRERWLDYATPVEESFDDLATEMGWGEVFSV